MINRNHLNYSRPVQVRPVPSSNRNDAPSTSRYKMGRAPDESVWSFRMRQHVADPKKHAHPGDPPESPKRAWLTQGEWQERDRLAREAAEQ